MINVPQYVSSSWLAKRLGTTPQNVLKSGRRALDPGYRGTMLKPDAVVDDVPVWLLENATKYVESILKTNPAQP